MGLLSRIFFHSDTYSHIGEKTSLAEYAPRPFDAGPLHDAGVLHFSDFVKIATCEDGFIMPSTLNSSAATNIPVDTSPIGTGMGNAVLTSLAAVGLYGRDSPPPTD